MPDTPKGESRPDAPPGQMEFSTQIVAVARSRDRGAFEVLFRHFAPRLKAYFLRSGAADGQEAEEMAQETMLLVWRKAALFDPQKAGAATWIYVIARNLRTDARRRAWRSVALAGSDTEAVTELPAALPGTDEMVSSAQDEAVLRQALSTLPQEQLQALELSYFEDQSHVEIARRLGIPLGTVKSRIRLALARLRAALGGEEMP
jgi:RNA polymerase sigma-70 factor (ECF subfamily)